ncbi:hypothetical protein SDC9_83751 [bioreactor metagenome]|uniref:Type II secretion system protein K n=1 Tax=bioreactor metagenome TaxID=1076179 RepID=A0A644Z8D1_9ZZZZ
MKQALGHKSSQGFALVAVLWLVAAMTVLVGGIMLSVRSELRTAGLSRQMIQAQAVGEAVMQIALQQMVAGGKQVDKLIEAPVSYGGQEISVRMVPMNGYIDLNRAPIELLQAAFQFAGGMDQGSAGSLAAAVDKMRQEPGPSGKPLGFEAVEDLLLVPGMQYPLYARIAPVLTTDAGGTGRVNVQAAPPNVLNIVAAGNEGAVGNFLQSRGGDNVGADTSAMNGAWIENSATSKTVEFTARVPLPDGGAVEVIRRYQITPSSEDGLPWRVFYANSRVDLARGPGT